MVPDRSMDAGVAAPGCGLHGVSPTSTMAALLAASFGRVGSIGSSGGWLGRGRRRCPDLEMGCLILSRVSLGPLYCSRGVIEWKVCAPALTTTMTQRCRFPLEDVVEMLLPIPEFRVKSQVHLNSVAAMLCAVTLLGA